MDNAAARPTDDCPSKVNVMIALVADRKPEIVALCQRFGIRGLHLFGSGATGAFDPEHSDLDFIVDLGEYERGVAKRYFAFCEQLEELVQRPVDVITVRQIANPYFRAEVNATRELIYHDAERSPATP